MKTTSAVSPANNTENEILPKTRGRKEEIYVHRESYGSF